MSRAWTSRVIDLVCGCAAYVGARLIYGTREPWERLHWELLTYAAIFFLLQAVIRGRRLVRQGKAP